MGRRQRIRTMLLSLILVRICLACGLQQDISLETAEDVSAEGPFVSVLWEENQAIVFLDTLEKDLFEGNPVWLLWDVLVAAGMDEQDIVSMRFDFESVNGFRPSSKEGCDPLPGDLLEFGYLDPEGLTLVWDPSLGLRGCYWVTQTAQILGESADENP